MFGVEDSGGGGNEDLGGAEAGSEHGVEAAKHLTRLRLAFQSLLQTDIRQQAPCIMSPKDCLVEDVSVRCRRMHRLDPRHRRGHVGVDTSNIDMSNIVPKTAGASAARYTLPIKIYGNIWKHICL